MYNNFAEIARQAKPLTLAIARRLLPQGRVEGHEYVALNPKRADSGLGSFKINITTGKWADFATGDKGGDVIALYAYLANTSQLQALAAVAQLLGRPL